MSETATERFLEERRPFLEYLKELEASWEAVPLERLVDVAGGPQHVAVVGVDILKGFCVAGPLASERVGRLVPEAVRILKRAHDLGVRHFLFPSDAHPPDSPEFEAYPPHCLMGTEEAELVDEIQQLPFSRHFRKMPKRSVSLVSTEVEGYLKARRDIRVLVAMGDVTDICVYQMAMHVHTMAVAEHLGWKVYVPASAVATWDLPPEKAAEVGAMPHDGDLLHLVFLYHMQLNGVKVVRDLV